MLDADRKGDRVGVEGDGGGFGASGGVEGTFMRLPEMSGASPSAAPLT